MQIIGHYLPSFRPCARLPRLALLGALAALFPLLPALVWAAPSPSPALARNSATPPPLHILSVDSVRLSSPNAYGLGKPAAFPGDPAPADADTRRFTVRWYAAPQAPAAVLLLEFASPSSPGVVRSRTLRLNPGAPGYQTSNFDVPFPDATYWQASILSSGRLLSRLQSPNWYEIRDR